MNGKIKKEAMWVERGGWRNIRGQWKKSGRVISEGVGGGTFETCMKWRLDMMEVKGFKGFERRIGGVFER